MNFNRDTEYALISLAQMTEKDRVYSARELSDSCNVPYGLLCKILQRLASAGVLRSIRGPRGGYRLAHKADQILLAAVETAVHENRRVVPCLDTRECDREEHCTIRDGVVRIQSMWDEMMSTITLAEFFGKAESVTEGALR